MTKHFERKQAERWGSQPPQTERQWWRGISTEELEAKGGVTYTHQLPPGKSILLNEHLLAEGEGIDTTVLPWIGNNGLRLRRYERVLHEGTRRVAFTFKTSRDAMRFKLSWG